MIANAQICLGGNIWACLRLCMCVCRGVRVHQSTNWWISKQDNVSPMSGRSVSLIIRLKSPLSVKPRVQQKWYCPYHVTPPTPYRMPQVRCDTINLAPGFDAVPGRRPGQPHFSLMLFAKKKFHNSSHPAANPPRKVLVFICLHTVHRFHLGPFGSVWRDVWQWDARPAGNLACVKAAGAMVTNWETVQGGEIHPSGQSWCEWLISNTPNPDPVNTYDLWGVGRKTQEITDGNEWRSFSLPLSSSVVVHTA